MHQNNKLHVQWKWETAGFSIRSKSFRVSFSSLLQILQSTHWIWLAPLLSSYQILCRWHSRGFWRLYACGGLLSEKPQARWGQQFLRKTLCRWKPTFGLISLGVDFEYPAGLVEEFFAAGHEFIVHFAVLLFVFFEIFCAVFLGDASVSLLLDDK